MWEEPGVQDELHEEVHEGAEQDVQDSPGQEVPPDSKEGVPDEVHKKVQEHPEEELQNCLPAEVHQAAGSKLQKRTGDLKIKWVQIPPPPGDCNLSWGLLCKYKGDWILQIVQMLMLQ